ncbi:type I restriction endonuclease subunit R [Fusobacterium ulcerans]|uniref:type I restriction endonuclease subunit R n=1 Tax=Fusobacterium ulcerans TaxID=861 RepID=UPI002E773168|nr:type I restriction endonuclease subunit R [Fusobacterium ulcerans]MEE0137252.1 type I restriction endonuclease subunit R [Fusobacterium ulcerans]
MSEEELEKNLIEQLSSQGYKAIDIKDEENLISNFKIQLEKFNKIKLSDSEFKKIQVHLAGGSIFEKAKKLRDKYELTTDRGEIKYISFIDKKYMENNIFQVTNQITMKGQYENRYDVTILINGLPLTQIELKKRGVQLKKAFYQIQRYQKHSFSYKALFQYIQIFIISNEENTKYFSNNGELRYEFTFSWTDEHNLKKNRLIDFTKIFLEKKHLWSMLTKYIVTNETQKTLMILRPYQYYAVEKIVDRVKNYPLFNGYIWHTTGSGKTLTSFKASQIIATFNEIDKVVFCVDRKDLDYQTAKEFNAFEEGSISKVEDTNEFVEKMIIENKKIVVTTIQKLNNAISKPHYLKQMEKIKNKRIVFIFDECHRTQFGDTHTRINEFFINKQFFGFTGTPIFADNAIKYKTTKDLFGECLHKYTIKEAIDDENVLGFSVEYYSTFNKKNKDGDDLSPDDMIMNGIDTKEVYSDRKRLENIVDFVIANHNAKTSNREYQSIFAVSDINTLIEYYYIFKEKNTKLKIASIFTYEDNVDLANDEGTFEVEGDECKHPREHLDKMVADYNEIFGDNFNLNVENGFNSYFIDISKKIKERKIDILFVVNMFLTGFDSKYLNTLYVDKNLKYHGLIQAYSRTNRILNVNKPHGNIVCFRNLKKRTDEAIKLFSDEDAIETVLMKSYKEYVVILNKYVEILKKLAPSSEKVDDLETEENKLSFIENFKSILRVMNKLGSFSTFDFKDLAITQDEFESYKSKYIDMYDTIVGDKVKREGKKTSIIDEIDFEIELLTKDSINVAYIVSLIKNLDNKGTSFVKDVEYILKTVDSVSNLKNKKELLENFINENREIFSIKAREDIEDKLADFIQREKEKAIQEMVKEEELNLEKINEIVEKCEFTEKIADTTEIKASFLGKVSILKLNKKIKNIQKRIEEILDKFNFFDM